jgi:protein gp37
MSDLFHANIRASFIADVFATSGASGAGLLPDR